MPVSRKTIFITINRGILLRNFFRSGLLKKLLQNRNVYVVVLIPEHHKVLPPRELFEEFESDRVKIEIIKNKSLGRWERLFNTHIVSRMVFSDSTKFFLRFHVKEHRRANTFIYGLNWLIFKPISRLNFVKRLVRWMDRLLFKNYDYAKYFDQYRPCLVFSTSVISHLDTDILKEAQRRGIKTVAMPRSWDNLDKYMVRVEPDLLLVQNKGLKKEALVYQGFRSAKIRLVGFPQFDIYNDKSVLYSREDYCRARNFQPEWPILFLGSEGRWSEGDQHIFEKIILARDQGLIPPCNILVRPHFSSVKENRYEGLRKYQKVYIDDKFRRSDFFHDNWDPNYQDMVDFTNTLYHCSLLITYASTLALDAACFDKPTIGIRYGARFIKGKDMTYVMYETNHYHWVLETGAVTLVNSDQELLDSINYHLENAYYKQAERRVLIDRLCLGADGQAIDRIIESLSDFMV